VEAEAEPRRGPGKTKEYNLADRTQGPRLARRKQRVAWVAGLEHDEFAADHVTRGLRVFAILLERGVIAAARCNALELIGDIAEGRARAEIGRRRHDQERAD